MARALHIHVGKLRSVRDGEIASALIAIAAEEFENGAELAEIAEALVAADCAGHSDCECGCHDANESWVEVTAEQFARIQEGKKYAFGGRPGRVVKKSEADQKNSRGMVTGLQMVRVRWDDEAALQ